MTHKLCEVKSEIEQNMDFDKHAMHSLPSSVRLFKETKAFSSTII